jgi:predicted RecB family nuclease
MRRKLYPAGHPRNRERHRLERQRSGGGREFLFGYSLTDETGNVTYTADWALTRAAEKAAFERFVDLVMARRVKHSDRHIYHYAPYEPAALKRAARLRHIAGTRWSTKRYLNMELLRQRNAMIA